MPLKKPSQLFQEERVFITEDNNPVVETFNETFDKFRGNLTVVENLTDKVNYLTEEIGNKITKSDLENAMFSHLMMVDESIKSIDAKVKGLNKNDLLEFKRNSAYLVELVEELTENQFPKYKKKIVDTEVKISEKLNDFKEEVINTQEIAENNLQEKLDNFAEVVDNNFSVFNENIQQTKTYVNETVNTYKKLSKILESKVEKENERLDEYSVVLENFNNEFLKFQENIQEQIKQYETINSVLDERFDSFGDELNEWKSSTKNDLEDFKSQAKDTILEFKDDVGSLKADIAIFESHNKSLSRKFDGLKNNQEELEEQLVDTKKDLTIVENYIQKNHNDIEELKEEVFDEIKSLPFGNIQENIQRLETKIDFIRETYSKIEPEVIVKEVIKEGFAEPPSTKNEDPLTPLDQNFVTLDQLQQHYRLFINRIQQQLSTLGGGETQLKYLDDIVGIATNASAYDGKYLKYNHSLRKFEFDSVDITNDSWADGINGPYTNGSVGIGTSVANCELDVIGNVCVTGVVTATTFDGSLATTNLSGTITNAQLAGSITNDKLVNSSVNFGGVTVSLGGTDSTPAFNLQDATGLPVSTGISGLGGNVATFLATPSSSNLASAVTDETGSGALVFATSPTLVTPVLGAASATSLTASGAVTANTYNVGTDAGISTTRTTVATTSATTIDSFAIATYRSARIQVQITQGTNYQASDVLVIHDGSTASLVEYASIATNDYLGTLSATISGGNCLLQINMSSATSATVKVLSQRITI